MLLLIQMLIITINSQNCKNDSAVKQDWKTFEDFFKILGGRFCSCSGLDKSIFNFQNKLSCISVETMSCIIIPN